MQLLALLLLLIWTCSEKSPPRNLGCLVSGEGERRRVMALVRLRRAMALEAVLDITVLVLAHRQDTTAHLHDPG